MSQRSARIAAAIATAEVSEPPRPSVVMRPLSRWRPWKPQMTATSLRALKRLISSSPLTSRMRAAACASEVAIGNCQPSHERALTPMACSAIARRPDVTCSPVATTASYSRASCRTEPRAPLDQLIGGARHGRDDDGDLVAAPTSRLTWRATCGCGRCWRPTFRRISSLAGPSRVSELPCGQSGRQARRNSPRGGPKRRVYIPARVRSRNRLATPEG